MNIEEKIKLNKLITTYNGSNSFILSLKKQLKSGKFIDKVEYNGKMIKTLSDKQYESAKNNFE